MIKLLIILLIGLAFEAFGVIVLKKGIDADRRAIQRRKSAAGLEKRHPLVGNCSRTRTSCSACCSRRFSSSCCNTCSAKSDVSFVWPLTAMSFVMTALAAQFLLHERVDAVRWSGVALIVLGAAFISYSEQPRKNPRRRPPRPNRPVIGESAILLRSSRRPIVLAAQAWVFFCNSINAPIFPGDFAMAHASLPKSRFLSGLASALKSSGKSSFGRVGNHAHRGAGIPRSRQTA